MKRQNATLKADDSIQHHGSYKALHSPWRLHSYMLTSSMLEQIGQGHISALEKLIDAYAMIGEAMPRFDKLSAAFKNDKEFQQMMGLFYEDILDFHRRAYKFFRQRGRLKFSMVNSKIFRKDLIESLAWKMIFDTLWKSFTLRFQAILETIRRHRDLIDQEANTVNIVDAKAWRSEQFDQIRKWRVERAEDLDKAERERLVAQTKEATAWLGASEEQ